MSRINRVGPRNKISARKPIKNAVLMLAINRMPLVTPLMAATTEVAMMTPMIRPSVSREGWPWIPQTWWMPPAKIRLPPASAAESPATSE